MPFSHTLASGFQAAFIPGSQHWASYVEDSSQAAEANFVCIHAQRAEVSEKLLPQTPDPRRSFMTDRCEDVSTPAPLPLIKITLMCSLTLSPKVPWDGAKDTLHGNIASLLVPLSVSVPLPHSPIVSFFLGKTTNK